MTYAVGDIYGKLTIIGRRTVGRVYYLICRCVCGNVTKVSTSNIRRTNSCGCSVSTSGGHSKIILYHVWYLIKRRTCDPTSSDYEDYGGRGIKLHSAWKNSYVDFRDYVSTLPNFPKQLLSRREAVSKRTRLTLDRIDNSKGYRPGNLRWATPKTQGRNQRTNHIVKVSGKGAFTLAEAVEKFAVVSYSCVQLRISKLGWPVEKALYTPSRRKGNP